MKKRTRTTKPPDLKKDDVIRMRVTAEQRQVIIAAAERDGLDVSAWLRRLALRAAGALPDAK